MAWFLIFLITSNLDPYWILFYWFCFLKITAYRVAFCILINQFSVLVVFVLFFMVIVSLIVILSLIYLIWWSNISDMFRVGWMLNSWVLWRRAFIIFNLNMISCPLKQRMVSEWLKQRVIGVMMLRASFQSSKQLVRMGPTKVFFFAFEHMNFLYL